MKVEFVRGWANDVCLYGDFDANYTCLGESQFGSQLKVLNDREIRNAFLVDDSF